MTMKVIMILWHRLYPYSINPVEVLRSIKKEIGSEWRKSRLQHMYSSIAPKFNNFTNSYFVSVFGHTSSQHIPGFRPGVPSLSSYTVMSSSSSPVIPSLSSSGIQSSFSQSFIHHLPLVCPRHLVSLLGTLTCLRLNPLHFRMAYPHNLTLSFHHHLLRSFVHHLLQACPHHLVSLLGTLPCLRLNSLHFRMAYPHRLTLSYHHHLLRSFVHHLPLAFDHHFPQSFTHHLPLACFHHLVSLLSTLPYLRLNSLRLHLPAFLGHILESIVIRHPHTLVVIQLHRLLHEGRILQMLENMMIFGG
nr:PREDICTED: uncharacterized protein LOC107767631 isoform X2 [Nicotiana tabacum]XP_016442175.1 PREDICTED: uncharacterized protein LOC107767631 isoform X2 [Nicotiana tabacum]XP_016442177.1 PREDICTED: uncharacterized protein LOC107767631 isoform X2 [Nicotiana tabacum]XP_016442178.1 PREDICTED: uncharacterized protein LOC107767631 isoform X2 [Nicotiana tabacum]